MPKAQPALREITMEIILASVIIFLVVFGVIFLLFKKARGGKK